MKPKLAFKMTPLPELDRRHMSSASAIYADLAYTEASPNQKLDLYLPKTGSKPYPLVIYLHTGAFVGGSKSDTNLRPLLNVLNQGYALAAIEYRSAFDVSWPAQIYDVKAAIRFLRAHADLYGLDKGRFALWGVSSGGYIAAMCAVTAGEPGFEDLEMGYGAFDSGVQAVVDWGGACGRMDKMDEQIKTNGFGRPFHCQADSPESIMLGGALSELPELCRLASPTVHIKPDVPYFLIQHGLHDGTVPIQQSESLAAAISKTADPGRVRFISYDVPSPHNGSWYETEEMIADALGFLESVL